jgi:hypothetical protein
MGRRENGPQSGPPLKPSSEVSTLIKIEAWADRNVDRTTG